MRRIWLLAACLAAAVAVPKGTAVAQTTTDTIIEQVGDSNCSYGGNVVTCSTSVTDPPSDGALPVLVTVSNGQSTDGGDADAITATISGSTEGSYSDDAYNLFFYASFGQQPNDTYLYSDYTNGGEVTLTNNADLDWEEVVASNLGIEYTQVSDDLQFEYLAQGGGGLVALSVGGDGFADNVSNPDPDNFDAGAGGDIYVYNYGSVTIDNDGSNVTFSNASGPQIPLSLNGIAALSFGGDGADNKTGDTDYAGTGGAGGAIQVISEAAVSVTNNGTTYPAIGILAVSQGGVGSNRKNYATAPGGDGGDLNIQTYADVTIDSATGFGIFAASFGGDSDFDDKKDGDDASGAGNGGDVEVTVGNGSTVSFSSPGSGIGVMAISAGGDADNSWQGYGGPATASVEGGGTVDTTAAAGAFSFGVLAISAGSVGDVLPFDSGSVNDAYPGTPGTATASNAGTVTTAGTMSVGVAALSIGGAAIVTNGSSDDSSTLGNVASDYDGFDGSTASATNSGSITTLGDSAYGMLAQSLGGGGGLLNLESDAQNAYVGSATTNTAGSNAGQVSVTHSGSIVTGDGSGGGDAAIAIVAQSLGGGGGSSNAPAFFVGGNDGDGSGGGDGGQVTVTTSGSSSIATYDLFSIGILAQSVGGGGGNGANGTGIYVALGGAGGNGGDGGSVTVDLGSGGQGSIVTAADFSAGVVAQSIGGGGGNGGNSTAVSVADSVSIGGTGGSGGTGSGVAITNDSLIVTSGNQAAGAVAQSVGGGGGSGGSANSYDAGLLTIAIAVGGAGGSGGDGGAPTVVNEGQIYTGCQGSSGSCSYAVAGAPSYVGANAVGILAQSVGGGGGSGGSATATSFSIGTDEVPVTLSFSFAVGASGGDGGDGKEVEVTNSGTLVTGGDAAHGIVAQSVGGGGGSGGDATATAYAFEAAVPSVKFALALGGSGGSAGSGGTVEVTLGESDGCSGCNGQVTTYGLDAIGVLAQSIGGGGGTGGTGDASASSQNLGNETGDSFDLTFGVGADGGSGNDADSVTVTVDSGSGVTTYGSGGKAVVAQSIGGGGGAATGGQASASGDSYIGNFAIGGSGGSGGDGSSVTVTNSGTIATGGLYTNSANLSVVTGGDGVGILAQSIGGGGGSGGNSDPAANIDIVGQVEDALNSPSNSYQANVGIGGTGGASGDGYFVSVTNGGLIQTQGVRAYGVQAQSIGGGGGSGGSATSTSNSVLGGTSGSDKAGTYAADLSIGGQGGAGGIGGAVEVDNSGSILTAGYGAHAVLAQSIGGGGGVGAEGTVDNTTTIGLGGGLSGDGGSAGEGYTVDIEDSGTLWTAGDDAYAILAQSIGGGGGAAGAGCSNSAQIGPQGNSASLCLGNSQVGVTVSTAPWNDASDFTITLGGASGTSGNGGEVEIDKTAGSVVTTGARASAIVAQSIGGGGGIAPAAEVNVSGVTLQTDQGSGSAGAIDITLASGVTVTTYGAGAFGLLAQAVGAGGGLGGDSSQPLATADVNNQSWNGGVANDGGDISVTLSADIATSGENAHGLFLQSLGNGGGLVGADGQFLAGNDAADESESVYGIGGSITVDQEGGSIVASGSGSVAIFAQSSGNDSQQNPITITLGGSVEGGSGGTGVWISGGISADGTSQVSDVTTNSITIDSGASLSTADGIDGQAILAEQSNTVVSNAGTLTGNVDLGYGSYDSTSVIGVMTNSGLFNSGSDVTVSSLTNSGTLAVGGSGSIATTALDGAFTQTSGGLLDVDIDALADQTADLLSITGDASVDGTIQPTATNLLPGSYTVATAESMEATATVPASYLFTWTVDTTSTDLSISPAADLTPSDADLSANEEALADYLQAAWDAGGSSALAPLYAGLSEVEDAGSYADDLDQLINNVPAQAIDQALASASALDGTFSCPVFEGEGTLLGESNCAWSRVSGGISHYGERGNASNSHLSAVTFRLGAQKEIAPNWFLGSTAAYSLNWVSGENGASGSGQRLDGGLAIKHTSGPWYLGAGFNLGYGWYDSARTVTAAGSSQRLGSDSNVLTVAGRLRGAYEFAFTDWYLRPYADFDLIYTHVPSYSETGSSAYALDVAAQDETTFGFSPMLETGGRLDLEEGWILRPYAAAGLLVLSDDSWTTQARLRGAPDEAGSFGIATDLPNLQGKLDLGLQLYQRHALEVKLQYGLGVGDAYLANSGALRIAYHF